MKMGFARIGRAILGTFLAATLFLGMAEPGTGAALAPVAASDVSGAIQSAQRQFNAGNYSGAIKTLQSAAAQDANNAAAQYWLARSYYELHDYDNAIAAGEKAVSLDPKNSDYHKWLGTIYGGKADRDRSFSYARKVKKEFEEAVRLDPSNISARRDLEEYSIEAPFIVGGSKDEAKSQVDAIVALDPIQGHLARAMYDLSASKKPELAEKEYMEVLSAKPRDMDAYFDVIMFFIHQSKAAELETAIQAASQANPNDPRLGYARGVSRVLSGTDMPRAEQYLKSYLASTPDRSDWPSHASAREWLGRLYEAEGKRSEAAEQYRAALQLDPGRKEAKARLQKLEKESH